MIVNKIGIEYEVLDNTINFDFWSKYYNKWEDDTFKFISKYLNDEKTFVDIGSWIGPISIPASYLSKNCLCLEPDTVAFKELSEIIKLNNINNIIAENIALTNGEKIKIGNKTLGQSGTSFLFCENSIECSGKTIEMLFNEHNLNEFNTSVIKIDIEGYEVNILNDKFLMNTNIPIHISLHPGLFKGNDRDAYLNKINTYFKYRNIDITKFNNLDFFDINVT